MAAIHVQTIKTPSSPSYIQLGCNGIYLSLPYIKKSLIGVWSLKDITCQPLELEGHRRPVTALRFSHGKQPTFLCSAAEDYIIVWNIEKARATLETGQQIRGQIVGQTLGHVQCLTFSPDDCKVAACVDREVYVLDSKQDKLYCCLEGHNGLVNAAEFCPHSIATLVTASDDRTFKIWDISSTVLLFQSTIISSSPFISLTMNVLQENFALGTADGQVRVYDLTDGNGFRCLHHLDVAKLQHKMMEAKHMRQQPDSTGPVTVSSRPVWQQSTTTEGATDDMEDSSEVGCAILSVCFTSSMSEGCQPSSITLPSFLNREESLVSDILEQSPPMLVIGTTGAIIQVNARTLDHCSILSLQEPLPSSSITVMDKTTAFLAGNIAMASHPSTDKVFCIVGSLFQNEVSVIQLSRPTEENIAQLRAELTAKSSISAEGQGCVNLQNLTIHQQHLSVLSSEPLCSNSPLKADLVLKTKESTKAKPQQPGKSHTAGTLNKKGEIVSHQPVTFHSKVKSSGYTATAPRRTMFQPKTNVSMTTPTKKSKPVSVQRTSMMKEYPMKSDPPTNMLVKVDVAERPTAINAVKFSDDGQYLACALANSSAQVFKMPLTGKGSACAGHSGGVTRVRWSRDGKWLLTAAEDKTAKVWALGASDPVITFATINNNMGVDRESGVKLSKDNCQFTKAVTFAQFYYMDKFILLTSGNTLYLYKYLLDTSKSDIKRYLSKSRYKLVQAYQMEEAQQITAMAAVNSFYSYLTLCAGSNKSIEVFDLNVGRSVRTIPDVHSRTIHAVSQNEGSSFVSHPSSSYDLFVTAAASDCIKLWDLKSNRCVRRYEGHSNRIYPCGLAISPCSRFIATGAEDRSAYIFDVRSGTYLHKLTGHTDTVADVTFHPLHSQLITATLDGKVRLFSER